MRSPSRSGLWPLWALELGQFLRGHNLSIVRNWKIGLRMGIMKSLCHCRYMMLSGDRSDVQARPPRWKFTLRGPRTRSILTSTGCRK